MPSMTADDDHPFDPRATSCIGMGIIASDLLAAAGVPQRQPARSTPRLARRLPVSPPRTRWMSRMHWTARLNEVYELDGRVLLLGVDHTANTAIHLGSETRATGAKKCVTLLKEGRLSVRLPEIDHCCQNFSLVDGWLESEGLQRRRTVVRKLSWSDRAMVGWSRKNSTERDRLSPSLRRG